MYVTDFTYDGVNLSSFNFIICNFNAGSGANSGDKGSEISFKTAPIHYGARYISTGTKYEKCLSTTFQICKDPDVFADDEMAITSDEFRELSRWLNRREYLWFNAFDNCDPDAVRPWVRASFGLTRIDIGGETVGIELNMETDSPFGYGDTKTLTIAFAANSLSKTIMDLNDEIGETYPQMTVTCGASGTLTLEDSIIAKGQTTTLCSCSIANCVSGEVISFSGETMIVSTSSTTHDIANDFNYDFFRFGNFYGSRTNTITASIPCTVVLSYRPIWKDTL